MEDHGDSRFLIEAIVLVVVTFTRKGSKGTQFGFGTWVSLEHVELGIPVNLPSRDAHEELELRRGVWVGGRDVGVIRSQIEIETVGAGRCVMRSDLRRTLRSTINVHWSEKGGSVS